MRTLRTYAKRNYITLMLCSVALIALVGSGLSSASGSKNRSSLSAVNGGRRLTSLPTPNDASTQVMNATAGGEFKRNNLASLLIRPVSQSAPTAAVLTATKTDNRAPGTDPALANPGDTINYTVVISNTGNANATTVSFADTVDPNTTFVAGSVHASPIAFDDTYDWVGNTQLDTSARGLPSVTANDVAVTDTFTLTTQTNAATTQGGTVTLSSNGHFVYTPAVGFTGDDTFTYTIKNSTDATLTGTGTVTIHMPVRVWYLQAGASGDGRSNTPSGNPAAISTSANASTDILYVFFNASTLNNGAFTLDTGQKLLGQGVNLIVSSINLYSATSAPTISHTGGDVVTIGSGNTISGLNITNGTNFLIVGSPAGLTVDTATLTPSGTASGFNLTGGSGTIAVTNVTMTGTGAAHMVRVTTGAETWTFTNSPMTTVQGRAIVVSGKTGGGMSFDSASSITASACIGDGAINLMNNSGGGNTFAFSKVALTTTGTARGLVASSTGTLNITDGTSTVASGSGTVVDLASTALNVTLQSVSGNGAGTGGTGMSLSSTTGSFTVNGTGSTAGSGGTVQNYTSRGASIVSSPNVTLKNMNFTGNGTAGVGVLAANCADALNQSISGAPAGCQANVYLQSTTTVVLNNVKANQSKAIGIWGNNVNGLTLTNVEAQQSGDEILEDGVQLVNQAGTVTVTGGIFKDNASRSFEIQNNSGTPTLNITGGTFGNTNNPTGATTPSTATAGDTILLATNGASSASITSVIKGATFSKIFGRALNVNTEGNTSQNVSFGQTGAGNGNTVSEVSYGTDINGTTSGSVTYSIVNNTFTNVSGAVTSGSRTLINARKGFGATGSWTGTVSDNTIGTSGVADSGCDTVTCGGISLDNPATSGNHDMIITNNTVYRVNGDGIFVANNPGSTPSTGTVRVRIEGNDLLDPEDGTLGAGGNQGEGVFVATVGAGASLNVKAGGSSAGEKNNVAGNWHGQNAGTLRGVRFSRGGNTTFCISGYSGPFDSTSVGTFITGQNTGNAGSATQSLVDSPAQFTGPSCPTPSAMSAMSAPDTVEIMSKTLETDTSAINHSYNWVGNTMLDSSARGLPSLFSNDSGSTSQISLVNYSSKTTAGGGVTIDPSTGHFIYSPPVGFIGTDSFNYTTKHSGAKTSKTKATATINLTNRVWYVDNSYTGANGASDGRSHRPFTTLAAARSVSAAGDYIFIYQGSGAYSGGIKLKDNQQLIGQGVDLVVSGITLVTHTGNPTITNKGTGILVANNDTIKGLAVSGCTENGITGVAGRDVIGLTIDSCTIENNGDATGGGIVFTQQNLLGTCSITNTTIQNNSAYGVRVQNSSGMLASFIVDSVTFNGTGVTNTNNRDGFMFGSSAGVAAVTVKNSKFYNNHGYGALIDASGGVIELTLDNNIFGEISGGVVVNRNGNGLAVTSSNGGSIDYIIKRNRIYGCETAAMLFNSSNGSGGHLGGVIGGASAGDGNTIGDLNVANSGVANGDGIRFAAQGNTITGVVQNSVISQVSGNGLIGTTETSGANLVLKIWSNAFNAASLGSMGQAISVSPSAANTAVCADIGGAGLANTFSGSWSSANISVRNTQSSAVFNLDGYAGSAASVTGAGGAVDAYLASANSGASAISTRGAAGAGFSGSPCRDLPVSQMLAPSFNAAQADALSDEQLSGVVSAAVARWTAAGISYEEINRLRQISFKLSDLDHGYLSQVYPSEVVIDRKGSGYGWFVDSTPYDDVEFDQQVSGGTLVAGDRSFAHSRMDLLTTVMQAMGMVLRIDSLKLTVPRDPASTTSILRLIEQSPELLQTVLPAGVRRVVPNKPIGRSITNQPQTSSPGPTTSNDRVSESSIGGRSLGRRARLMSARAGESDFPARPAMLTRQTGGAKPSGTLATFTQSIGTLPQGKSVTIKFQATVNALNTLPVGTSQVCNQGTVTADGGISVVTNDPDTPAANDPTCTQLNIADLAVTKSDAPDPVIAGNNITYTIGLTNNGPAAASTVTVTDAVPANTTFVSATFPAGWARTDSVPLGGTGNIVFSKASVANAETASFTIVVKVTNTTAHLTVISNSATAASTTPDTQPANNTATAMTTVTGLADLTLSKSAPATVNAGSDLTYTLNFSNAGPGTAVNVAVTDAVPAGTTFVSASVTSGSGWSTNTAGPIVFSKASVPSGETVTFQIVVNVPAATAGGTIIHNSASATADTSDPTPATSSTDTTVIAQADLALTKTGSPTPDVIAGNQITYTIGLTNSGPAAATSVSITDPTPANTTFVSATVPAGWSRTDVVPVGGTGTITFTKATVANAETASFTIVVKVNSSTANNTTITNTATASATTTDPAPANNSAMAMTNAIRRIDLSVTKSDAPDPVNAGSNITYTINFSNAGPSDASTVTVTDAVPANTTFVSAMVTTGSGWSTNTSGPIGFSKAAVTAGESAVFTIVVKVNSNTADAATISNSVTAAATETDTDGSNNTANASTTVQARADLVVTKSDAPDPVNAGGNLTYTINFSNAGPSDAQTVMVTDMVPAGTSFVSAMVTTGAGWAVNPAGPIVFSKATVVAGESAVFTIVVNVPASTASGATIMNSATASSATTDPVPANNTGMSTTTVQTRADLAITKDDSPDPSFAGNNITYTIGLTNNGPSDAQSVSVTDPTPSSTTFVSATFPAGWSRTDSVAVGGTGTITFTKAPVASGESASFTIVVKVDAVTPTGTNISNTATASTTTIDPNDANNMATATTNIQAQADLALTKTASPTPNVIAGTNLVYTINLTNNGPGAATSVTVTDPTPANTTFFSASVPAGWTRTDSVPVGGTGSIIYSKAAVANGETATFIVVVKVNSSAANNATITNTATAASTTADPDNSNNAGIAMSNVIRRVDLSVLKIDSPDPVIAGNQITYTIGFNNSIGPSDASNVTVTDSVPGGTSFVSAMVTTGTGWGVSTSGPIVFSKAAVTAGESAVFTIVVSVPSSTANGVTINNSATAAAIETDIDPSNDTANASTSVITRADLVVTKSDAPDPVNAGGNLTYTINFTNAGPSDAQMVMVSDAVPAGTSLVSAMVTAGAGWAVSTAGPIVFSKGTVGAGESAVFTIVVSVPASTANGATINNSATASSATTDPTPGNNIGMSTTTVQTRADLAVTKSDAPDPVNAGSNITYTINFANNGPSDAQTVTVTDAVPANTTFVSAVVTTGTGWAVNTAGPIVFSKATVAAGETAVFTMVVQVNSNTASGATISNSATAASATTDPTPANNTATANTTVQVMADLAITKSDSPDPVIAGNNLTYTINLTNNGPSDASTVSVSDTVPTGTTFVSAMVTSGSGWAVNTAGPIVFSKATVVNGETATFQIVVKVNANVANGATISNTANVTSTSSDGTTGNNSATATTTVQTQADLAVTKSDSPDPVTAGTNLTYTINFANNGPSDAQTVTVTDAVPAGTTFVSAVVTTGVGWSTNLAGPIVFSKATVAAGESAVFTMVVNVNANTANGATITNSATAATATTDPTPGNNTGTATTTVQTRADLAVTKSGSPTPNVFAGNNITYTINFVNNGPSDAQTVTVTDAVPASTTLVSATVTTGSGWSVNTAGPVVFSKATVAAGETAVFTIVVKVNSNTASGATITNSAVAASATTDPTPGNNTGTASTAVQTQADLAVTKTDSPDPVVVTQNLTYTINFVNNGPSDAQTVTVTDAVPANTTFLSATITTGSGWSKTNPSVGGTGTVQFSKATVAAGETAVFTIVVNVNANTPNNTILTNSATAATATTDPNSGNNTGTASTTVIAQADLAVTKSASPNPVCVDGTLTYTINFVDNGPGPGLNTTATDAVPANTTLVSATVTTGSGWSTNTAGPIVFSKANVAIGETAVFTIVVKINSGVLHGTVISNTVTAASSIPDPSPGNNTAVATSTVDPIAPTITCPANIVKSTDPNQCSAVVNYPAPTVTDNCPCSTGASPKKGPTVQTFCVPVCNPPSGSTFQKGTTTVNCSASDAAGNQSSCSFTVTVNDTQPPSITCPADITIKTPQAGDPCKVVTYPAPVVSDNCPGVGVVCTPPSGSCFPVGTTTVTCTATDTSGNTVTCTFKVNVFDLCVQDDSDPSTVVLINSVTGDYRFCCHGVTYTGRGTMTIRGSTYQLEHNPGDRRVLVKDDEAVHKGSGSIGAPPGTIRCTITDRNTLDNSCVCQ
jgi:uncharacterized repeat protein (TIGR01451 family)